MKKLTGAITDSFFYMCFCTPTRFLSASRLARLSTNAPGININNLSKNPTFLAMSSSLITEQFRIHNAEKFAKRLTPLIVAPTLTTSTSSLEGINRGILRMMQNSNYGFTASPTLSEGNVPPPYDNTDFYNEIHDDILIAEESRVFKR